MFLTLKLDSISVLQAALPTQKSDAHRKGNLLTVNCTDCLYPKAYECGNNATYGICADEPLTKVRKK